jgi:hypothetical protein
MALAGNLNEFPLTDLIQLVDLSKKTGAVSISGRRGAQQLEGSIYFRDGKIVGASCGALPPLEAAYAFFTLAEGPFQFHEGVQIPAPTITASNEMIIMEGVMRQDAWAETQEQLPSLSLIPRLVPNPASSGSEISLEADEWRVLTMVNGKNTVGQIAQRSGLGELRTCEIIARLLSNGLVERRAVSLSESLFPELDRIVLAGLGSSARALLYDAYTRAGIHDQNVASAEQIGAALDLFEPAATRTFGAGRVRQPMHEMRALVEQAFTVNR